MTGRAKRNAGHTNERAYGARFSFAVLIITAMLVLSGCSTTEVLTATNHGAETRTASLESSTMFGAFTYGGVWQGLEPILQLELNLGRRLDVVHWFTNWENPYFPDLVTLASQGGRKPLISWQSHNQSNADIAAGVYDDYIRDWARGAATASGPIYVRLFPEMNGSWTNWNGDPAAMAAAWRHVVDLFRQEGAYNVQWVFSPNVTDSPRTAENAMELYYPGDDYVDVLALDGYNWGETLPETGGWRSFEDVFRVGYDRITAIGPQPVWIAEFASSDEGGDKSAWVRDMFATTGFQRIEALIWFNEDKEADWRIDSDAATLQAFRDSLSSGTVLASTR